MCSSVTCVSSWDKCISLLTTYFYSLDSPRARVLPLVHSHIRVRPKPEAWWRPVSQLSAQGPHCHLLGLPEEAGRGRTGRRLPVPAPGPRQTCRPLCDQHTRGDAAVSTMSQSYFKHCVGDLKNCGAKPFTSTHIFLPNMHSMSFFQDPLWKSLVCY